MDKRTYYTRLILKYFFKKTSSQEDHKFEKWLKSSQENQKLFDQLQEVWMSEQKAKNTIQKDAFISFKQMMHKIEQNNRVVRNTSLLSASQLTKIAAVFILIIGGTLGITLTKRKNASESIIFYKVSTRKGEQRVIILPDSTRVWLSGASTLEYPKSFDEQAPRQVRLHGEGFFDVTKDPGHPFIVQGNALQVKVLGTRFRFVSDTLINAHHVNVTEGKVRVTANSLEETSRVITAQQQISLINKEMTYSNSTGYLDIPWNQKQLEFSNMKFLEIAAIIERTYAVKINYPSSLKEKLVTVSLPLNSIYKPMRILGRELRFDFIIEDEKIQILPKTNPKLN